MNNTLVNGLRVLEELAHSDRPLGVSELAERLDLAKSNAHRLLQSLAELGYVRKHDESLLYSVSLKLWELGSTSSAGLEIRQLAMPAMARLLEATRETVHLSMLDAGEVVYVHKLDSPEPVRSYSEIGGRAPAHCVATGKAMLAHRPGTGHRFSPEQLVRHTPNTIVEPEQFEAELAAVRQRGYAVNRGEWRETVWGVAAPITDARGVAVAAIGISGPAERIRPLPLDDVGAVVRAAAASAAQALADHGS